MFNKNYHFLHILVTPKARYYLEKLYIVSLRAKQLPKHIQLSYIKYNPVIYSIYK